MSIPTVSFKEFSKNPIVALLFLSVMALGFMYYQHHTSLTKQIDRLDKEVIELKKENKNINEKLIETLEKIKNL
jgi:hypothetical protein